VKAVASSVCNELAAAWLPRQHEQVITNGSIGGETNMSPFEPTYNGEFMLAARLCEPGVHRASLPAHAQCGGPVLAAGTWTGVDTTRLAASKEVARTLEGYYLE
jgi:hypothetical protein